jgi:hypothetical protein
MASREFGREKKLATGRFRLSILQLLVRRMLEWAARLARNRQPAAFADINLNRGETIHEISKHLQDCGKKRSS